jgi:hypothetical protein
LEERRLLSVAVPIPTTNPRVGLSSIFWNGEMMPLNPGGKTGLPSPASVGAAKTITITNTGPSVIYPFLRGQNGGTDPNDPNNSPYDPQDRMNHEFREYIGYRFLVPGGRAFLGLPPGASITVQVPLALWDGDNLYLATSGAHLTSPTLFGYDPNASITVVGSKPVSGMTWVQGSKGYPRGIAPLVMFYYSGGPPMTLPNDAPAQLTEVTFRDQYLTNFISDPAQTFPLVNYDVSYVNNLVAPVSMEASHAPITYQTNPAPAPPTYYGYQDYGWLATDRNTTAFEGAIDDFTENAGAASIGQYFGSQGWPQYYNPNPALLNVPSGANLFANSPLNVGTGLVHVSTYDPNHWLLTSNGSAPIQAGGAGVGFQGFVSASTPDQLFLANPSARFVSDLRQMLQQGAVSVSYPGSATALGVVTGYVPNPGGMPYVTVQAPGLPPSGPSGKVYAFTRTASDYAVTAITNLWYSWAQYYVQQYQGFAPEAVQATLSYSPKGYVTNQITLASTPPVPLAVGMTVTAAGVPSGTTILKIDGSTVYLSQIPDDGTASTQMYTFSKPQPIMYDPKYTTPYPLSFDAMAAPNALLFAGSVYEAMAAEAGVNPLPPSYLPYAMNLVSQVIQFYAKLPGYQRPDKTGDALVGEVRDMVKSILRGVYDFKAIPDQTQWYPNPATPPTGLTSGQDFNVFNLDPYVWFVHRVEGMSAYGFSVDDDVANPTATGPLLDPTGAANHFPNNLQIEFSGVTKLGNPNQWFPTIPWGTLTGPDVMATIGVVPQGYMYQGDSYVQFVGPDALKIYNQINNPGTGQVGATITAPGFIPPGTTLVFKGPISGTIPQIVLSQMATTTTTPIPVTVTAQP